MKPTFLRVGIPKSKTRAIGTVRPPTEAGAPSLGADIGIYENDDGTGTTHSWVLPENAGVGDLCFIAMQIEAADISSKPSGWTTLKDDNPATGNSEYVFVKVLESSDVAGGETFTIDSGQEVASLSWYVTNTTATPATVDISSDNADHDPPEVTVSSGAGDYWVFPVWIANKGSFPTDQTTDGPSGYSVLGAADVGGGVLAPAAYVWSKVVSITTSENPGAITWSDSTGSRSYSCVTIAVPPEAGSVATADHTHLEADVTDLTHHVIVGGFGEDNLAASLTDSQLYRQIQASQQQTPVVMPYPGSVLGISVASSEARTAGTATFEVFINGTATGLTTVLDGTDTQYAYTTQAIDTDTFVAGDRLDVRVTTDGTWAPTTADVEATIYTN